MELSGEEWITEEADKFAEYEMNVVLDLLDIIVPIEIAPIFYTEDEIHSDIEQGLYSKEDFTYLAFVVSGEAGTFEGYVAVAYEVLNRCNSRGKSVKEIVIEQGQYTCIKEYMKNLTSSELTDYMDNFMSDDIIRGAVVAVLRGEAENPIGNIENHFGKINGYDVWYENKVCKTVIVIGEESFRNVFFYPPGSVHNKMSTKTDDAVVIYNSEESRWELDGVIKYEE